ncbi:MAG TPA: acyltransferase [Actinomycetota bacterium]|nr:acyltransferase [Actinomycetota bacterium]
MVDVASGGRSRDALIDAVRAISLLVVVTWHWVFTTISWRGDGPHASNPIGVTRGFWLLTWLLQVMPLFFFAGGYVHSRAWLRGGGWGWVARRLRGLLAPAATLVAAGLIVWVAASRLAPGAGWVGRGIILVLSPLWFLLVYALLVAGMPLWWWLHARLGEVALVLLVGLAVVVDVFRFKYGWPGVEWVNMVAVWALSHQMGFHYERLVEAPRRFAWCLALGGLIPLFGLTNMGLYPRSMVGVPGEEISNMAPPTLCIAALTVFQIGVILLCRDAISRWAAGSGRRIVEVARRHSMRIFLWHAPGFAIAYGLWRLAGLPGQSPRIDAAWWASRPLWFLLPILPTVLLSSTVGRALRTT